MDDQHVATILQAKPRVFYSYLWLREDGSPYYAGKGIGDRAFLKYGRRFNPPRNRSRILVFPMLNEVEAFESERALIELFGRKDLGTGCLRNMTDGGDGASGMICSSEARKKMSAAHQGKQQSQEVKDSVSRASQARWDNPEYRAALSAKLAGINRAHALDPDWRRRNALAAASPSARLKKSLNAQGKQPMLGHKHNAETRLKMSASHRKEAA
jgi:NUMOD3 motif